MPPAKLHKLVELYLDPDSLLPDDNQTKTLLAKVQSFERTSLAGDYYMPFDISSENCTKKSTGTTAWIAECNRLLNLCVVQTRKGSALELRQSLDIIFGRTKSTRVATMSSSSPTKPGRGKSKSIGKMCCLHGSGFYLRPPCLRNTLAPSVEIVDPMRTA
jgi:hypothetical protein